MIKAAEGKCGKLVINSEINGQPVEFDQKVALGLLFRVGLNLACYTGHFGLSCQTFEKGRSLSSRRLLLKSSIQSLRRSHTQEA